MDDKLKMIYSARPKNAIMESEYESPSFVKTKRYYKEVNCRACNGKGSRELSANNILERTYLDILCEACMGRGTQTVLEREEV